MTNLRLVLARHGETPSNVRMALDSAPPGPSLTEEGRRQAAELARTLAAEPVVAVYASTAVRAQETAKPVAAAHGLDVEVIEGIQEVFVGELNNRTDEPSLRAFYEVFSTWANGDLSVPMPGGESAEQVLDRYHRVVRDLRARHSHGVVVVLSHGAAIRLVAPTLVTNIALTKVQHALLPNTGRVVLDDDPSSPTGWRCLEWTGINLD